MLLLQLVGTVVLLSWGYLNTKHTVLYVSAESTTQSCNQNIVQQQPKRQRRQLQKPQAEEKRGKESWYQYYDDYPPYCSTPSQMEDRSIPPLSSRGETRLLHVTAIIRHGARTPYSPDLQCWDGFWDQSVWNCSLTPMLAPPSQQEVLQEEADSETPLRPAESILLFEKRYDALLNNPENSILHNALNGTCQLGQLLLRGYEQELRNGQFLHHAYAYDSSDEYEEHDERMRLIDMAKQQGSSTTSKSPPPWDPSVLRYRADDDERTLMSGQVFLRGFLGDTGLVDDYMSKNNGAFPVLPLHTADRAQDILDANNRVCPKLKSLVEEAHQSDDYQAWNASAHLQELRQFSATNLGRSDPTNMLDCLMTTICTDRPLPPSIDDYSGSDTQSRQRNSRFQALADYDIQSYNLAIKHNGAAHAKLSMAPVWAEIVTYLKPWISTTNGAPVKAPKLSIISGHDTTIMPLLASLGANLWNDTEWAPYASMMLLEVHEFIDGQMDSTIYHSNYAFRLIYNGQVMTQFIQGCPPEEELCDASILLSKVEAMATLQPDCSVSDDGSTDSTTTQIISQARLMVDSTSGILLLLCLMLLGGMMGGLTVFIKLTGRLPGCPCKILSGVDTEEDERQGLSEGATTGFEDEPETMMALS